MFRSKWIHKVLAAAAFSAVLVGIGSPAYARDRAWWWPFRPQEHSAPEIDAGLARSAAAILVGGLLVLRGRRRRS
jgi:hypothetical protein